MTEHELSRREFVKVGAAGAASMMLHPASGMAKSLPAAMPDRPLGRTGHRVKLFSLGGQATLEKEGTHDESIAIINRAIDLGVNYIDTAAQYGRGISQTYIGEVMATRRDEVYLATKTHDRTRDGSLKLLEESLKLLQTDHIDCWQIHRISRDEDLDQIFGKGGAMEAVQQARDEGIIRFAGITGHSHPDPLIRGISEFDFDTILMALNPADPHYLPFVEKLLPLANNKGMGVIGMKVPARGRLFREDGVTSMKDAMTWVLTQPVSTVIIGCDNVQQLEENIAIATGFEPMPQEHMARLSDLTVDYAKEAQFYKRGARQASGEEDY